MRFPGRVGGAISAAALVAVGAVVIDLDPAVVIRVSPPADGIWVPVDAAGEVVHVDAATGRVTARVEVATDGSHLHVGETEEGLVVVDERTGDVASVDRALHRVDRRAVTGIRPAALIDFDTDGVAIGNGVEAAYVGAAVDRAEPITASGPFRSLAAHGKGALLAAADHIEAVDASGATTVAMGVRRPALVRVGEEVLWSDGDELRDLDGARRGCVAADPGPDAEWAGHPTGLVATVDSAAGVIGISDTLAGTCRSVRIVEPGTELGRAAIALGVIFVPEPAAGLVHIVDPAAPTDLLVDAVTAGSDRLDVHVNGDVVIAHDPLTSIGAILDRSGVMRPIDTAVDAVPPRRDEVAVASVEMPSATATDDRDAGVAAVQVAGAAEHEEPVAAPTAAREPSSGAGPPARAAIPNVDAPPVLTDPPTTSLPASTTTTTTTTTSTTTTTTTTSTTTTTTMPTTTTTVDDDDDDDDGGDDDDDGGDDDDDDGGDDDGGDDDDAKPGKGRGKPPKPPKGDDD